jgi:O-antigen/teichoic acid export membrane protein
MNSLFSKFLSFSMGSWVNALIGIISIPLITRLASTTEYAQITMFTLAMNILLLVVAFGMEYSFVRFYYNETQPESLLRYCIKWPLVVYLLVTSVIWLYANTISYFLFQQNDKGFIVLLNLTLFFQIINRFSLLLIRMAQRAVLYSILNVLSKIIELGIIILFFTVLKNIFFLVVLAQLISLVIITFISILYEKEKWYTLIFNKNSVLLTNKQEVFKYALPFVPTMILTFLFQWIDRIAIRSFSSFEEIGLYSAAYKVISILMILQYSFSTFWTPVSFERYKEYPKDIVFFKNINDYLSIFMFIIAVVTILLKDFIVILLGSDFREAVYIMPFLIFVPIMQTLSDSTVNGINFFKKTFWHIIISIISFGINIVGNLLLVPNLGAKGAAISTGISYIIFFILRTHISSLYFKVNYSYFKIYSSIILLIIYSFYASFFDSKIILILGGIGIILFILLIYLDRIKEIAVFLKNQKSTFVLKFSEYIKTK